MTTLPPIADDELMELVRSADPLDGDPVATETAEALLQDILATPRVERRRRATRVALRLAAVGTAAAVVIGAALALTGDEGNGVTPASAAVVRHAIAALAQAPGTILHVDMRGTQDNGDGTTIAWRDESWQLNAAPYSRRQVETTAAGTTVESGNVGAAEQVYDPATDTIYVGLPSAQSSAARRAQRTYWLFPGPRPHTYTLRSAVYDVREGHVSRAKPGGPRETIVITTQQARALKDGTDVLTWKRVEAHGAGRHPRFQLAVVPASSVKKTPGDADPSSPEFRRQILALLRSGRAHLVGPATVHGRDALEIRSRDGHTTYYVDPKTYAPIQLDTTGTDGGTSLFFDTYEVLPANDTTRALLSLTAQHPSATVDRNRADYVAAEHRLFPTG
jgi:hypothetical protein